MEVCCFGNAFCLTEVQEVVTEGGDSMVRVMGCPRTKYKMVRHKHCSPPGHRHAQECNPVESRGVELGAICIVGQAESSKCQSTLLLCVDSAVPSVYDAPLATTLIVRHKGTRPHKTAL